MSGCKTECDLLLEDFGILRPFTRSGYLGELFWAAWLAAVVFSAAGLSVAAVVFLVLRVLVNGDALAFFGAMIILLGS